MSLLIYKNLPKKKFLVINFIILFFTIYQSEVVSFPNTFHKFGNKLNAYRESAITYSFDNSYYFSSKRLDNRYFIQNYHYTSTLKSNMRYLDSFNKEKNSNLTQNIGKSAKYIVSLIAAFFIIFNESWIPMYYILCGVVNSTLSKILKHIFKQPRPIKSVKKGYGLPSSHAQSIFYFATIVSISSFRYFTNSILSIFISAFIWIYSYLAWYLLSIQY
jgi:membrane-associated phospholipid phosphatase